MLKPCSSKLIPMAGFQKGQSGNPKGRRKAHLGCQKLRDLISDHSESLIKRLLLAAVNDGDVAAAKLLIDRAVPPLKALELPTPFPIPPDASLADQGRAVVLALSRGKLPASQAGALLQGLATLGRLFEVDEILERLGRAEAEIQAMAQRPPPVALPIGNQSADSPIGESAPPPEPEPAPDSPHVVIELEAGESLADVAEALGITSDELDRQIAAGLVVITPATRNPHEDHPR